MWNEIKGKKALGCIYNFRSVVRARTRGKAPANGVWDETYLIEADDGARLSLPRYRTF